MEERQRGRPRRYHDKNPNDNTNDSRLIMNDGRRKGSELGRKRREEEGRDVGAADDIPG
jgi:hypothetical protein